MLIWTGLIFLEGNYIDASNWVGRWNVVSINDISWIDLDLGVEGIRLTGFSINFYSDGICGSGASFQTERSSIGTAVWSGSYWVEPSKYTINVIDVHGLGLSNKTDKARVRLFEFIKPHLSGTWSISKGIGDLHLLKLGGITLEKKNEE